MKFVLWIPGKFSLNNKMLSNLRAAGYAKGKADARGWHRPIANAFAAETRAIRLATKAAARKLDPAMVGAAAPGRFRYLTFWVFGHGRHDPDAWYLLAKAITDGLADAGLVKTDRTDVAVTRGQVLKEHQEQILLDSWLARYDLKAVSGPGVVVMVQDYAW